MHECPDCGQDCDCDGEDTWWDNYPDCEHWMDPDCRGDDYFDDYDDYADTVVENEGGENEAIPARPLDQRREA